MSDANNERLPATPCSIVRLVIEDMAHRSRFGLAKYGTTVGGSRIDLIEWHQHHYEELLDAAIYTRKIIETMKAE